MSLKICATDVSPLRIAARDACLYALPMTELAAKRADFLRDGAAPGELVARQSLPTFHDRHLTTPNVDALYASTFIDLSSGPAMLTVPPLGDRYASIALVDMFSENFAVLGSRTVGQGGGTFMIVGPTAPVPPGAIRSPTRWVLALARVVVNGPDDVGAASQLLHGFAVDASPATDCAPGASRADGWDAWLTCANALMLENPAPAMDRRILDRMAPLGLGDPAFDPARFTPGDIAEIVAGLGDTAVLTGSAGFGGRQVGGWIYPASNIGSFFQDYLGRARIAASGHVALPPAEAAHMMAVSDAQDGLFDGDGPWRIYFPADGLPPVDAFWSLTMYEAQSDGMFLLTENAIDRYAVSDRMPGLNYAADGALTIAISRTSPGPDLEANWLPAPASGPFLIVLRTYLPRTGIVAQTYAPPPIERAL